MYDEAETREDIKQRAGSIVLGAQQVFEYVTTANNISSVAVFILQIEKNLIELKKAFFELAGENLTE